jgi:hypothetical protein
MMLTILMMKKIRDNMLFMSAGQKQIMALGTTSERERVLKIIKNVHKNKSHALSLKCDWCDVVEKIEKGK